MHLPSVRSLRDPHTADAGRLPRSAPPDNPGPCSYLVTQVALEPNARIAESLFRRYPHFACRSRRDQDPGDTRPSGTVHHVDTSASSQAMITVYCIQSRSNKFLPDREPPHRQIGPRPGWTPAGDAHPSFTLPSCFGPHASSICPPHRRPAPIRRQEATRSAPPSSVPPTR